MMSGCAECGCAGCGPECPSRQRYEREHPSPPGPKRHYTDWQQRVVDERDQLAERLVKLTAFLSRGEPTGEDKELLRAQRGAMWDYLDILNTRIEKF